MSTSTQRRQRRQRRRQIALRGAGVAAIACALIVTLTSASRARPTAAPRAVDAPAVDGGGAGQPSLGGEPRSVVRVGNLIYAGTQTSRCFADHFLARANRETTLRTSGQLHPVRLDGAALFDFPLVVMSGEGPFALTEPERENLRRYLLAGGLVLASAGCSSPEWDRSFRAALAQALPDRPLAALAMDHPVFHSAFDIDALTVKHGVARPLEAFAAGEGGRLSVLYSFDGLNDTANTTGCCCCGGNELTNAELVNVNVLAYALLH